MMLLLPMLLAASVTMADATTLAERLAGNGYGATPIVTIGALPPDWTPSVPLPQSPILGSVFHADDKSIEIFYAPNDAAAIFSVYEASLKRSGFAAPHLDLPGPESGGFMPQNPQRQSALLCHGSQGVMLRILPGNDLRVSVSSANAPKWINPCSALRGSPETMLATLGVIPPLRAPDGVAVTPGAPGLSGVGYGPSGVSTNVTYGATFDGKTTVGELLETFVAQMRSDGWRQDGSGQSQNGAFAAFSRNFNGQTWTANLLVYSGDKLSSFRARIIASGNPLEKPQPAPPPNVPRIPTAIAKRDTPIVLELMRRIVGTESNHYGAVFIRKAPPDLSKSVLLPRGMLLGSTVMLDDFGSPGTDTIYYDLTRAELEEYQRDLKRAGWSADATRDRPSGFVSARDTEPLDFCKQGEPVLTVNAQPGSNAVSIALQRSAVLAGCHMMPAVPNEFPRLPKLVAPGARATHLWTTDGGSAAAFLSAQSPKALLDAFAVQMRAQGWRPLNRVADALSGTATFLRTSGAHGLTAAITVSRRSATSRSYLASMTVATQ